MSDTENPCRLYLAVPHDADTQVMNDFEQALGAGDIGCVLLRCGPDGVADRALARNLLAAARAHDVAFLVEGDVATAQAVGADGVHVTGDETSYEAARAALVDDAVVGVACSPGRDAALTLAAKGADYVAFTGGDRQARDALIEWWAEVAVVPVVAWMAENVGDAAALAALGADFVALEQAVWSATGGPAAAVHELSAVLAERRSAA